MASTNPRPTYYNKTVPGTVIVERPVYHSHLPRPRHFGPSRHWVAGDVALFVGDGLCMTVFENLKTSVQLKKVDLGRDVTQSSFGTLTNGIYTNFWKSLALLGSRWLGNFQIDGALFDANLPLPYPLQGVAGVLLGTALVYPLDLVRTRQGAVTFDKTVVQKDKHVSVLSLMDRGGLSALYAGLPIGLLYAFAQQAISRAFEGYVFHPSYFSVISSDLKPQLASFCALAAAKILLNPVEIAKKRAQNANPESEVGLVDTITQIYDEEGLAGLFAGWEFSIPEAFATVVVTHLTYKGVIYLIDKYYSA